jgi:arylsulfatase A-like enzyme
MKKNRVIAVLLLLGLGTAAAETKPPNVVFILADDLGWSDTTLYGTTRYFETPHIQALADSGVLLSQAYTASPVCTPTRASIMTGQWPARYGLTQARGHLEEVRLQAVPVNEESPARTTLELITATRLPTEGVTTLADFLKSHGYHTAHFGKWHLGHEPYSPLEQGFDIDVPHTGNGFGNNYLAPWGNPDLEGLEHGPGDHIEDVMAREAAAFIKEQADIGQPFFLNYWAFSIHSPWYAKEEYADYFRKKRNPLDPQSNPVYAAMVRSFDDAVGVLLKALDEAGIRDNTLIVFTSDNGGNTFGPAASKTGPDYGADIPGTNSYPLRAGKGSLYEGGVRVPTVFSWAGRLEAGSANDAQFNSVDYFPTIAGLLDLPMPDKLAIDGANQAEVLKGGPAVRHEQFYYYPHYSGSGAPAAAVRQGDWKLVRFFHGNVDQSHREELYNLHNDIAERQNVAGRFKDKHQALSRLLDDYLDQAGAVLPLPNPAWPKQDMTALKWR